MQNSPVIICNVALSSQKAIGVANKTRTCTPCGTGFWVQSVYHFHHSDVLSHSPTLPTFRSHRAYCVGRRLPWRFYHRRLLYPLQVPAPLENGTLVDTNQRIGWDGWIWTSEQRCWLVGVKVRCLTAWRHPIVALILLPFYIAHTCLSTAIAWYEFLKGTGGGISL